MTHGTVKWFSRESGFGFIAVTEPPLDVFVHASAIVCPELRALGEGQQVQFELILDLHAPRAANVALLR